MKNKILLTFLTITVYACNLSAQPGAWTWLKGDPNLNSAFLGNNGIQGVPAATNQPPFFYEAPTLMDTLGNLFLIGGGNGNGQWSDVWRYNTATNEWTWMKGTGMGNATGVYGVKGVSSPANQPADISLGSSYDNTKSGIFYIYGGSASIPDETPGAAAELDPRGVAGGRAASVPPKHIGRSAARLGSEAHPASATVSAAVSETSRFGPFGC